MKTNETKHRPGKWTVARASGWAPRYLVMDGVNIVCEVEGVGEKALLTAHKLAAANDLLEALEALTSNPHLSLGDLVYQVREAEGEGWDGPAVTAWGAAVEKARAAIAKARGENGGAL